MIYIINNNKYSLSYKELREKYLEICNLPLSSFLFRLPEVLHITCMISYLKEVPNEYLVGDESLIHNLAHLMHIPEEALVSAKEIKEQFEKEMKLI